MEVYRLAIWAGLQSPISTILYSKLSTSRHELSTMTSVRATIVLLLCLFSAIAQSRSLAFSFDDGLNPETTPNAQEWNDKLLKELHVAGITAMIFPSLTKTGMGEGLTLLGKWSDAGHKVGNHTSLHRSLNADDVSLSNFIGDITEAEAVLRRYPNWTPMLRFPFLKEGNDSEKRDGIRTWMAQHGYRPASVSIDASDWYYNAVFLTLLNSGDAKQLEALRQAYLQHIVDRAAYYDQLAIQVLGRSPSHVILLHVNAINAAWLGDVIAALKKQSWTIVATPSAYADAIYDEAPNVLPAGESIVWSLAKAAGMAGLRYPAEDSVYEEPQLRKLGLVP